MLLVIRYAVLPYQLQVILQKVVVGIRLKKKSVL